MAAEPGNSEYALWLGRAFGRRAETSSPSPPRATPPRRASISRRPSQLNPKNLEALSDLFEYYLEAPGFLGGGFDKAQAMAGTMAATGSGRGPLGAGQAGREAQGVPQRRGAVAPRDRGLAAAESAASSTWPTSWPNKAASRRPTRASPTPRRSLPTVRSWCTQRPTCTSRHGRNLEVAEGLAQALHEHDALRPTIRRDREAAKLLQAGRRAAKPGPMFLGEALSFSAQALRANPVRSLLTGLGMVIGTASVILVVTISLTSRDYILEQVQGIGSNIIFAYYVSAGPSNADGRCRLHQDGGRGGDPAANSARTSSPRPA